MLGQFLGSLHAMFDAWLERTQSPHTRRAYRRDVYNFFAYARVNWAESPRDLLRCTVADVQGWRDWMVETMEYAPKTVSRRLSSVASFYKFVALSAAEQRLPVVIPNPAHAQFISRGSTDPVRETKARTATRARQLMGLPAGETVLDYRDRAILKLMLYTGIRIGTACRLTVGSLHDGEEDPQLRVQEKGD